MFVCETHSQQLHRYRNRYLLTQVSIELLGEDKADDGNNTDHECPNVRLWEEITNLQHSLERE